jgi:hypothetical protein
MLGEGPTGPQGGKLVSSSEGKLARMLLAIPKGGASGGCYAGVVSELLKTLPSHTWLVCLANTSSVPVVEGWLTAHRRKDHEIVEASDDKYFSIWAQDPYAIVQSSAQGTYFLEPHLFRRYADDLIADLVASATDLERYPTSICFEGGNMLIGDDGFWLLGADSARDTVRDASGAIRPNPGETFGACVKRLIKGLDTCRGGPIYVASDVPVPSEAAYVVKEGGQLFVDHVFHSNSRGTRQPLFHIDMFLTLAGKDSDGKSQILVGDPSHPCLEDHPPSPNWEYYSMKNVFDSIAQSLEREGFHVHRNPLPLTFIAEQKEAGKFDYESKPVLYDVYNSLRAEDCSEVTLRSWYFASANNALVEISSEGKRVWLPGYADGSSYEYLRRSDSENEKLWRGLGFDVTTLPNCHCLARGMGGIHCIQKDLALS